MTNLNNFDQDPDLSLMEKRLGHVFADPALLEEALTHRSTRRDKNYERLEFLGDRVLSLVIAEMLMDTYPEESEGDWAKRHAALVQESTLATLARRIDLGPHLVLSETEREHGGAEKDAILADTLEAVIGALYRDGGLTPPLNLIKAIWQEMLSIPMTPPQDPKTALQEWAQGQGLDLPVYSLIAQTGPDHAPLFTVEVFVNSAGSARGDGTSKRMAEKEAASRMLQKIEDKR